MKDFATYLEGVQTVAIAGHVRPDGDCVGSCLATYNYIKDNYPKIEVALYLQPIPNIFKFLSRADEIMHSCEEDKTYDLFIAQDCGDLKRLGDAAKYFETAKKTICVDHHVSNDNFADENYIFPYASSASELVFGLIGEKSITKKIAECIYVGMVHDTGVFQYSCTSAKTMEIAGKLMEMGIDFSKIVDETFYTKTFEQNRILGKALLNSRLLLDGKMIASVITMEEMKQYHVLPKHLDGIVNQLRVTKGVEAAVFLYENEDGSYKVSTRSNGLVNVAELAVKFGGGGHERAAGFSMEGTPEDLINKVAFEIEKQL
ncbi:bifunctional oligoribonuclease/PAP phosphatase NrnA [Roseburia sp. BX1005]|uniref:Bifunctional oligoribonuclease/PAP phosphatase NrnA n=1 Tax=Roseburia zhanii TaxID=2763064 RepID=A0A923LMJ0_9FIRM|nr:bifunctional oligoribonuclease/PAP phosphatase NrnA [Roseburia zhanii]MBC5713624.1 bifunctional oligoribonuclease/PAP phosphatase NrnA [Roseburia zhanii]